MISFAAQFGESTIPIINVADTAMGNGSPDGVTAVGQTAQGSSDIGLSVSAPFITLRELEAHVAETHLLMQLAKARYRGSKSLQDATEAAEWATAKAEAESALLAARRALAKADELTMGGEWVDELGAR